MQLLHRILAGNVSEDTTSGSENEAFGEKIKELHKIVKETKIGIFRNKVKALSKMIRMLKTIREEKELILELKGVCPGQKIPHGLIQLGRRALEDALVAFNKAKEFDQLNERMPPN